MYKFIDVTEVSESILPSEALKINGEYIENLIPGYRTLNVSGREALSPELVTFETGARDGSSIKSKRYPARTIIVKYQLIAEDETAFRQAYNTLGGILDVENATLIFDDEEDKYYIGTPSRIGEVTPGLNSVVGEFELFCADPFKYSVAEYVKRSVDTEDVDDEGNTVKGKCFVLDYKGTYKSFPTLEAEFFAETDTSADGETVTGLTGAGDCGFVAFFNEKGKIVQIGNPDETDGEDVVPSQTLVNQNFNMSTSWGTAAQSLWALNTGATIEATPLGTLKTDKSYLNAPEGEYYLSPDKYGSVYTAGWHGPTITRTIPADSAGVVGAENCTLTYKQKMCINEQNQRGGFHALLVNTAATTKKVIAGVTILKSGNGKGGKLTFYVNDVALETMDIDLSLYNPYFGADSATAESVKTSIIKKEGDTVTFNIGGIKKSYKVPIIGNMRVHEITFGFFQHSSKNKMRFNGLYWAKLVKDNCSSWEDIPNKFSAGDVVKAICKTGEILLNNAPTPEYGALGNDWEEFYLQPGENIIGIAYSDWVSDVYAPSFKLRYREVFL